MQGYSKLMVKTIRGKQIVVCKNDIIFGSTNRKNMHFYLKS